MRYRFSWFERLDSRYLIPAFTFSWARWRPDRCACAVNRPMPWARCARDASYRVNQILGALAHVPAVIGLLPLPAERVLGVSAPVASLEMRRP